MHNDEKSKIGSAMYLNKSSGQYIPFILKMTDTSCSLIEPMLD